MPESKIYYTYGDKLPGALLSDAEWKELNTLYNSFNEEERSSSECIECVHDYLKKLESKYWVGENVGKCILCGRPVMNHKDGPAPYCTPCYKAIYHRRTLRFCGNTRGDGVSENLACRVCGKHQRYIVNGLCRNCLHISQSTGIDDTEQLRKEILKVYPRRKRRAEKVSVYTGRKRTSIKMSASEDVEKKKIDPSEFVLDNKFAMKNDD